MPRNTIAKQNLIACIIYSKGFIIAYFAIVFLLYSLKLVSLKLIMNGLNEAMQISITLQK